MNALLLLLAIVAVPAAGLWLLRSMRPATVVVRSRPGRSRTPASAVRRN